MGTCIDLHPFSSLQLRDYCQIPKLILNQLRWLDHIVNGKVWLLWPGYGCYGLSYVLQELCAKLLELIDVASSDLKREVIASLPEVLDDSQHTTAAAHLK